MRANRSSKVLANRPMQRSQPSRWANQMTPWQVLGKYPRHSVVIAGNAFIRCRPDLLGRVEKHGQISAIR